MGPAEDNYLFFISPNAQFPSTAYAAPNNLSTVAPLARIHI